MTPLQKLERYKGFSSCEDGFEQLVKEGKAVLASNYDPEAWNAEYTYLLKGSEAEGWMRVYGTTIPNKLDRNQGNKT